MDSSARARLADEARIVGIRGFTPPTLEAVDRRRSQLWIIAFVLLVCMASTLALLTTDTSRRLGFAGRLPFRVGTIVLVVALAGYVMEKERHLRRLSRLLIDERVLGSALSNRLKELAMLYEAGKAMNSVLVLDEVLRVILSSAFELLGAASGSIMLVQDADTLSVVCTVGNDAAVGGQARIGHGIAGRVAAERQPLLIEGSVSKDRARPVDSAVCVPLVHRDELLGVLSINGTAERSYTQHDLRAVSMFAEHAAMAVANARLYAVEQQLTARLSHEVVHDPLTGIPNRVLVKDRLTRAVARSRRSGRSVGVLFIDLDNFKLVNDELGHDGGDLALTEVARRLVQCIRPSDTVGRHGGDEFVVICEDLAEPDESMEVAGRIMAVLSRPLALPHGLRQLSVSIGVATTPGGLAAAPVPATVGAVAAAAPGSRNRPLDPAGRGRLGLGAPTADPELSAAELLREADRRMYRAKAGGKARIIATSGGR